MESPKPAGETGLEGGETSKMDKRPSKAVISALCVALAGAVVTAVAVDGISNWEPGVLVTLVALAVISDLSAVRLSVQKLSLSASFLAIVTAAALLGPAPAAVIGVTSILAGYLKERYALHSLLINTVTYAWFPLIAGLLFHAPGFAPDDVTYYLWLMVVFCVTLAIDFAMIAVYVAYVTGPSFSQQVKRSFLPLLPSELSAALLALGVAFAYHELGTAAVALVAALIVVFQHLVGALLISQERAEELERRAHELAGFQMALLAALLRTLDMRDRMAGRHSAAVARYAREIAASIDLSETDQDLAHTSGLLHDIGKFALPDTVLKARAGELTKEQWQEIRRHPEEGARIVSQIDGYQPVGEIIVAHHERVDGAGYPRGLGGEEIPLLARVVAVADAYDAMTARDSYKPSMSSHEAIIEMRRVAGAQLDGEIVEAFISVLADKDLEYRIGADVTFEEEFDLERRIGEYARAS